MDFERPETQLKSIRMAQYYLEKRAIENAVNDAIR